MNVEKSSLGVYHDYHRELKRTGEVLIQPNVIFSASEMEQIDALQTLIPEEAVQSAELHDPYTIFVKRLLRDEAGELPTRAHLPIAGELLNLLDNKTRREIFGVIFGGQSQYCLRRCQINRLIAGSRVGRHRDTAANPDYVYSAIIQLGRRFEGGEFVVHSDLDDRGTPHTYVLARGAVLVIHSRSLHEVKVVTVSERQAIALFYAPHNGVNRLQANAPKAHLSQVA